MIGMENVEYNEKHAHENANIPYSSRILLDNIRLFTQK